MEMLQYVLSKWQFFFIDLMCAGFEEQNLNVEVLFKYGFLVCMKQYFFYTNELSCWT